MIDKFTLKLRQSMPLKDKIRFTQRRITEWVEHFGVNGCYVSFSGGKDSTVLLYMQTYMNGDWRSKSENSINYFNNSNNSKYPLFRLFISRC